MVFLTWGPRKALILLLHSIFAMIRCTKEQNNGRILLELLGARIDPHHILPHKRQCLVSYITSKEWHRTYQWALRRESSTNLWISLVSGLWYKHQFIQLETLLNQSWAEANKGRGGGLVPFSHVFVFVFYLYVLEKQGGAILISLFLSDFSQEPYLIQIQALLWLFTQICILHPPSSFPPSSIL